MKRLMILTLAVLLAGIMGSATVLAQPVAYIKVEGLSPQELHDLGWTTPPSTGLSVVGNGELVYLSGSNMDSEEVTAYTWSIESAPAGSQAALDSTDKMWTTFRPDSVGQYDVKLEITTASGVVDTTITINAALYVGVGGIDGLGVDTGGGQCAFCHATNKAGWEDTRHASKFTRAIDGIDHSFYAEGCIQCHTVGYDTTAVNGGFDDVQADVGWEFPASLQAGNWDSLKTNFPDLAQKANIQCENCHGPGSQHLGDKSKIALSIEESVCGRCHEEEPYHRKNIQWKNSRHAVGVGSAAGRAGCADCHSGWGFIARIDPASGLDQTTGFPQISCAVCHDPHGHQNPEQLRRVEDVTLNNGEVVTFGGRGRFCMSCHISRRNAETYVQDFHSHFGPHHSNQTDMLAGTNAIFFGMNIASSNHKNVVPDLCVTCHMAAVANDSPGKDKIGEHTWNMRDDGGTPENPSDDTYNVAACQQCHGPVNSFDDFTAKMDYDRNGAIESIQDEVEGLLHAVGVLLPPLGEPEVDVTPDFTALQLRAAYNHAFVEDDGSHGLHNAQFAINLLKVTHEALTTGSLGACAIDEIADVPNDQGRQVRIIWCRFGGDGVGNMPILDYNIWRRVDDLPDNGIGKEIVALESLVNIPSDPADLNGTRVLMDGELWDFAGTVPAAGLDEYSAIVPTLFDSTESDGIHWSVFAVSGHTRVPAVYAVSEPDSGYSLDNLAPEVPLNLNALETTEGVVVEWDEAVDEDVKFFSIYRRTTGETELIDTVTEPAFTDVDVTIGMTYYYRVSSTDFAGNESELSSEFALLVTSVEGVELAAVPDDYVLLQNYPNPFNPSTEIAFGLPKEDHVTLVVYNVLGARVRTLAEGTFAAGHHSLVWQGDNDRGKNVGPGMYIYRLETSSTTLTMKMILLK